MGQSIGVKVYETKDVIKKLVAWGANDVMSILRKCGTFLDDERLYVLVYKDFSNKSDPDMALHQLFREASCKNKADRTAQDFYDAATALGVELKNDD